MANLFQTIYNQDKEAARAANSALAEQGAKLKAMTYVQEVNIQLQQAETNRAAAFNGFIKNGGNFAPVVELDVTIMELQAKLAVAEGLHDSIFVSAA